MTQTRFGAHVIATCFVAVVFLEKPLYYACQQLTGNVFLTYGGSKKDKKSCLENSEWNLGL